MKIFKRGKFNFKPKKPNKKYKPFQHKVKSRQELDTLVRTKPKLKAAINKVFSKQTFVAVGVTGAVATGVASIWNYIESNSGCFKKNQSGKVCKVQEFSCCQKDRLSNVPDCDPIPLHAHLCDTFDESTEGSCCKLCKCSDGNCEEGDSMQCQRPTVADALGFIGGSLTSRIWSFLNTIFPWASYVVYGIAIILAIWILSVVLPVIYRILPRKRNQDV